MVIHLQGMGLLGSLTAWQLYHRNIKFTWDDAEESINAWSASTGACYPSGGSVDTSAHNKWLAWSNENIYPTGCIETCAYWVDDIHKTLPHGLNAGIVEHVGGLQLVGESVHCNAQRLVQLTREKFNKQRLNSTPNNCQLIVSHGFSIRRARYLWGWTRLIKLKFHSAVVKHGRPSIYCRKNRFQFAYCYPQPGTSWWYAGSNLISQVVAKPLNIEKKYTSWKERFQELVGNACTINQEGEMLQGWRPAKGESLTKDEGYKSSGDVLLERKGVIYYPTMASNGFRHFPIVWKAIEHKLKLV